MELVVYKTCNKCGVEKPTTEFHKDSTQRDELCRACKECKKATSRRWHATNKERANETSRRWHEDNRDRALKYKKAQYQRVKAERLRSRPRTTYDRRYSRKRYANDVKYRIRLSFASRMNKALKGLKAGRKWCDLVGYDVEELRAHLEVQFQPGMSWDNYGEWHIDHIKPVSQFTYTTTDDPEFKECWSLDNLQPLWATDNLKKSNTWTE